MESAIKQVDGIIARRGECLIGGIMEKVLRVNTESLVNELKARGYVVRRSCQVRDGYVVYPRRTGHIGPHMIIEVI